MACSSVGSPSPVLPLPSWTRYLFSTRSFFLHRCWTLPFLILYSTTIE
jgi:hypothetical protein